MKTEAEDIEEDTSDREESIHAVANCRACELSMTSQLLALTFYQCSHKHNFFLIFLETHSFITIKTTWNING
jgi:hypothetical protein